MGISYRSRTCLPPTELPSEMTATKVALADFAPRSHGAHRFARNRRTTWVVRGAGFGHGVGMSAYGAYGFARHDFKYRRILRHYYTDTKVGGLNHAQRVRVLLGTEANAVGFSGATKACRRPVQSSRSLRAVLGGSSVRLVSKAGETLANCGQRLRAAGERRWISRVTAPFAGAQRSCVRFGPERG